MSVLTTDNYSLGWVFIFHFTKFSISRYLVLFGKPRKIFLLTPFHFINVFGIFPFLLSQPWILRIFQKKDIFTRLRLANTCCSTYTNGSK